MDAAPDRLSQGPQALLGQVDLEVDRLLATLHHPFGVGPGPALRVEGRQRTVLDFVRGVDLPQGGKEDLVELKALLGLGELGEAGRHGHVWKDDVRREVYALGQHARAEQAVFV